MRPPIPGQIIPACCCSLLLAAACLGQTTGRVSVSSSGAQGDASSSSPSVSADGRFVAFQSVATNLVPGDTNGWLNIFVHDLQTGVTERVSVSTLGAQGNNGSYHPSISADGRYVAFYSQASSMVIGDANGVPDIFLRDRVAGTTELVSLDSFGNQANGGSSSAAITTDGRFVAFSSTADNLVAGDTNGRSDIFVRDLQTGLTELVSADSQGIIGNERSYSPAISTDGRFIAFYSRADNLVPGINALPDVFLRDRLTGTTECVSVNIHGYQADWWSENPSISSDGRFVAFDSAASDLVTGDLYGYKDIFVRDLQTGTTERVSVNSYGLEGNADSSNPSLSADGRWVVFESEADNLVPGDTNGFEDIFVHDRQTGMTQRLSVSSFGAQGDSPCEGAAVAGDGRRVAFHTDAGNLVSGDSNGTWDVFLHDRWDGLGANSIHLAGPSSWPVIAPLTLSWFTAPSSSSYWLAYSLNRNGSVFGGHAFDLGAPTKVIATGVNSVTGMGNYYTTSVPAGAAGYTVYFEVAARAVGGILFDSNALAVTFY